MRLRNRAVGEEEVVVPASPSVKRRTSRSTPSSQSNSGRTGNSANSPMGNLIVLPDAATEVVELREIVVPGAPERSVPPSSASAVSGNEGAPSTSASSSGPVGQEKQWLQEAERRAKKLVAGKITRRNGYSVDETTGVPQKTPKYCACWSLCMGCGRRKSPAFVAGVIVTLIISGLLFGKRCLDLLFPDDAFVLSTGLLSVLLTVLILYF